MVQPLAQSAQRGILIFAALLSALLLSYFSIRTALAAHFAALQTPRGFERAIRLEPGDARNWYQLGRYWQYHLEGSDAPRAIHAYLSALSINPRSTETWLDLATAYESEGNPAAARDAFLRAKKAYPLSAEVSWRYGNFLLRQGELDQAFLEIRRAVEADPKRGAEAFSRALRAEPDVEKILDRVLPPRANVYVDAIWDQTSDGNIDNALKVWDRLAIIRPRLLLYDTFVLVDALISKKRMSEAHRVWDQAVVLAGFSSMQDPPGSLLWDGGFESGISGGGFSWFVPPDSANPQISVDSQEKHSGAHSLRLMFNGKSNVNFLAVCHFVPVQPSAAYQFSAWVRTRSLTTDQGVRFQLRAFGPQGISAVVSPDVRGSAPWTRVQMPWLTGKNVQGGQVCLSRLPSEEPENKIQGTAWVDDVALVPATSEHAQP
jgi:tetratricopeptide (TPR) repeat protein